MMDSCVEEVRWMKGGKARKAGGEVNRRVKEKEAGFQRNKNVSIERTEIG